MTPKKIIIYKNGIHLETFPIFFYGSHDAVSLLADLLDGYFPRQLEKSFPDGVLLQMIDKLDTVYDGKATGMQIGSIHNDGLGDMKPVSKDAFLQKFPEKVIGAEGQIIELRKNIESRMQPRGQSQDKTPVDKKLRNVFKNEEGNWVAKNDFSDNADNRDGLAIVKVRLDFINEQVMILMTKDSYLSELLRELMKCVPDTSKVYKLVNGFPRKELDFKNNRTLEELELYPKAAIYMVEDLN